MYLGIDYGKKKIGLAISEGISASGIGTIANSPSRLQQLKEKVSSDVETIILGLPNSPLDSEIRQFAQELEEAFKCKIVFEDETFSTNEALTIMIQSGISRKKRRKDDAASAVIILERYLEKI
ncbi:MAG: Holliday junction resolvase RuvX [bacterium]|nr:Holliday junction resolvase RuvX [bacterium]